MKYIVSLLFIFLTSKSFAQEYQNTKIYCTDHSIQTIYDKMIQYEDYAKVDDNMKSKMPMLPKMVLVDMTKSQIHKISGPHRDHREEVTSDVYLLTEFRPLPKKVSLPGELYPMAISRCKIIWNQAKTSFQHICKLEKKYRHFSMDDLIIDIRVNSQRAKNPCVDTQPVSISISYQIDVNKEQFQAIQNAAMKQMLGGFGNIMKPLMPILFNPATFFDVYYGDYYQTWIDQLNAI